MIGKLRGLVDEVLEDAVVIDVGGVGYHVYASARTLASLPPVGKTATLIIETHVREDHIHLFGFSEVQERDWFRLLYSVQRVGAKMALLILGNYAPNQLAQAIMAKDTSAFSRISGVGSKLAERIVSELKDKVAKLPAGAVAHLSVVSGGKKKPAADMGGVTEDAISALVNLGYTRSEAYAATIKACATGKKRNLDDIIKLSLKELAHG